MRKMLENASDFVDADYEDKTDLMSDAEKIENDILNEFNASKDDIKWTMKVYRAASNGKIDIHLFDCSPADLPINDRLRENYGTGTYLARVYKNGKLSRVLTFAVEAPKTDNFRPDPGMSAVAQALQNQAKLLETLINKSSQQTAPMDMAGILSAIGSLMSVFKQMMPPPPPPPNMELFFKGMEFARDFSSGNSNFIDVIRDVLKSDIFNDIAKNLTAKNTEQNNVKPAMIAAPKNVSERKPENNSIDPEIASLAEYLKQFIGMAQKGSDPLIYADVILDNIDEHILRHFLGKPHLDEHIKLIDPAIAENWGWFNALINAIREGLETSESSENDNRQSAVTE